MPEEEKTLIHKMITVYIRDFNSHQACTSQGHSKNRKAFF